MLPSRYLSYQHAAVGLLSTTWTWRISAAFKLHARLTMKESKQYGNNDKVGAVLTAFTSDSVTDGIGLNGVISLFSDIMVLVALLTLLIPETKGTTLEDIDIKISHRKCLFTDESLDSRNY
jgi:hypothetical protein